MVFDTGRESAAKLGGRIERALADAFGFDVIVFLRSTDQIEQIAGHQPFPANLVEESEGKLQVSMLADKPAAAVRKQVLALGSDEDRLAFGERELYWLPSGLMRDAGLDLKAAEKLLGPWTMRTKGTVELLAEKYFADA